MPRYLVQRSFAGGLRIAVGEDGANVVRSVVQQNAGLGVTWVHSYVSADKQTTFCIYDGSEPESIRVATDRSGIPCDRITEVSILDPYFYR